MAIHQHLRRAPRHAIAPTSLAANSSPGKVFNRRLNAFERANAEFLRACLAVSCSDDESDAACLIAGDAYDRMIATPAPSLEALAQKLDALHRWSSGSRIEPGEIKLLAQDAARLLGLEYLA